MLHNLLPLACLSLVLAEAGAQIPCYEGNRGANLGLGFAGVVSVPLGFTFPGPAGPITGINVAANGFVWLSSNTNPGIDITVASFAGSPCIAALWSLLDPSLGGGVYFASLPASGLDPARAVVTWDCSTGSGSQSILVQLQLLADGRVIIYHDPNVVADTSAAIVGISGGGSVHLADFSRASSTAIDSGANPVLVDYMPYITSVGSTYDLAGMTWELLPNGNGGYICVERTECRTGGFDRIGVGCPKPSTFYDYFQAGTPIDLGNHSLLFQPNGVGGWIGTSTGTPLFTGYTNNLNIQPFGLATSLTLPWSWPHPGGSTTQVDVAADGLVWLNGGDPNNFSPCCDGDIVQFLGFGGAALAPMWLGLDPSAPGSGVFFDVGSGGGAVYVTWANVPVMNGAGFATFQLVMLPTGAFEFRYGNISNSSQSALAGYTTGFSQDPGSRDLLATPWNSGVASASTLDLRAAPGSRPGIGQTFALELDGFGVLPTICGLAIAGAELQADLAPFAPGCRAFVDFLTPGASDTQLFFVTGAPHTLSFALPASLALVGLDVFVQAGEARAGANAIGIVFSNGGLVRVGH